MIFSNKKRHESSKQMYGDDIRNWLTLHATAPCRQGQSLSQTYIFLCVSLFIIYLKGVVSEVGTVASPTTY